jgi:hypothetical protein
VAVEGCHIERANPRRAQLEHGVAQRVTQLLQHGFFLIGSTQGSAQRGREQAQDEEGSKVSGHD